MKKLLLHICSPIIVSFLVAGSIYAHDRALLRSKSPSRHMQELIRIIRNLHSDQVPLENLPAPGEYFVRISPRRYVLTDRDEIKEDAVLASSTKPFVFLTTPESIFGKSLLEIYADIGYEAEDIIRFQRNEDMVAILFRYRDDEIKLSKVKDGNLEDAWPNRIYATTWENILSLFTRLVQDEQSELCKSTPATRICLPKMKAEFVSSFPVEGKDQVKKAGYRRLQAIGGSDWEYRKLLEDTLSVFEHFRGDGFTENELLEYRDKPGPARLREVVGPNRLINSLPEVAIIHLGKLTIEDDSASRERLGKRRR